MPYCISCGESVEQVNSTCDQCELGTSQAVAVEARRAVAAKEKRNGEAANGLRTREVVVTDFKMSFGSMIIFTVKFALASIPAFVILYVVALLLGSIFSALLSGA